MTLAAIGAAFMAPFMLFGGGSANASHHTTIDTSSSSSVHQSASCTMLDNALYYGEADRNVDGEVTKLQAYLYAKGYLDTKPTGFYGLATVKAVKAFQRDNNIQETGYVGAQTRAAIENKSCDNNNGNGNNGGNDNGKDVWITSIETPSTLKVNQTGTWTVNVKENSNDNLHYSVVWGDENTANSARALSAKATRSSGTFTHEYTTAGTYSPTFTVTDDHGHSVTKSVSVRVGENASVSIAAINPTSGAAGTRATITGSGFTSGTVVHFNGQSITPSMNNSGKLSFVIPSVDAGTYDVAVENGNGISNVVSFKVTKSAATLSIAGLDAPASLKAGQSGTWTIHLNTSASSNLHYSVVWGDEGQNNMMTAARRTVSTSGSFSHTYSTKGTYNPKFTITDDNGHTVTAGSVVRVTGK